MSESTNVANFLKKVSSIKNEYFTGYLPSQKKELKIRSLNLKQQKEIISSVADGVAGLIAFTRILNNVIIDASEDSTLRIYDKAPLAVALRVNSLGATYKDGDREINLEQVINNIKNYNHTLKDVSTVEHNGILVSLEIPTLLQENQIIKKLEEEIKRNGDKNNTKNLGSIYIYEIIKYITSIKLDDITVEYNDLKVRDKIDIIEGLPLALNKKIINFIEVIRKEEKELLTVDDHQVEINPGFFDAE